MMTDLIKAADALAEVVSGALPQLMNPDEFLCCPGRDCSCLGATVHQFAGHTIQSALTDYRQARESADGAEVKPREFWLRRLDNGTLVAQITETQGLIKVREVL